MTWEICVIDDEIPVTGTLDVDGDVIYPENRTTVHPQPQLLGVSFATIVGDSYFVGTGAATGPGPLTFYDESQGGRADPCCQISYVLEENDAGS